MKTLKRITAYDGTQFVVCQVGKLNPIESRWIAMWAPTEDATGFSAARTARSSIPFLRPVEAIDFSAGPRKVTFDDIW